jgi:hypothetical protein
VVPDTAVFVKRNDHNHVVPLRAMFEMLDEISEVAIARGKIGITRMLI